MSYNLAGLRNGETLLGEGDCDSLGAVSSSTVSGNIVHPSGLTGTFKVTPVVRGRSYVPRQCVVTALGSISSYAYNPRTYAAFAITQKTFSGAGVPSRSWSYGYSPANASWSQDCASGCTSTVWTDVVDPDGHATRHTFSNRFDETEGQLQRVDRYSGGVGSSLLRSETSHYATSTTGPWPSVYGTNLQSRMNLAIVQQVAPLDQRTITRDKTYTFDHGNRLRQVMGRENQYLYDGHGRRVASNRLVNGSSVRRSIYGLDGKLLFVQDQGEATRKEYIYLGASLIAERSLPNTGVATPVSIRYQHTDALGSPVAISNESGVVVERTAYEPYGWAANRAERNGPGYTGHHEDAATGLVYMQQRYYDPLIGRFLSVDPVTAYSNPAGAFNRYWYANDNPYRFTDPDGRQSVGEMINSGAQGCGAVSCAGWAVLHAAWTMTGAESLSQVADKGWSNVGTSDKIGAVAAVVAVVPVGRIAGKLAEGAVGAEAAASAAKGTHAVYQGIDKAGDIRYVGITARDTATRGAEHVAAGGGKEGLAYQAVEGAQGLTKQQARVMEQTMINHYGMEKNGGQLLNKINSIAPKYWKENGITP